MSAPRVLVGTSVHFSKDYCLDTYIKTIMGLTYTNYEIFLSDNSPNKNHARMIYRKYGVECDWVEADSDNVMSGIAASQNQIRRRVLYGNYDWWLNVEQDNEPPNCVIQLLLAHDKHVVSLPYMIGKNEHSTLALMDLEPVFPYPQNNLATFEESMMKFNGELIETYGSGLGCTLIHRSVLEAIPDFGIIRHKKRIPSDSFFFLDCHNLGIVPYLDTSIGLIPHNNQAWQFK